MNKEMQKAFWGNLEKELKKSGLNRKDFAKKIGIKPPYLTNLLDHKKSGQRKIFEICRNLGKTLSEMVGEDVKFDPEWTFNEKARDMYDFLTNIVSEGNEGSRKGYSRSALCEIIIEDMKKQLIKENDLKKTDHRVR